jgi:hypothetical protein
MTAAQRPRTPLAYSARGEGSRRYVHLQGRAAGAAALTWAALTTTQAGFAEKRRTKVRCRGQQKPGQIGRDSLTKNRD